MKIKILVKCIDGVELLIPINAIKISEKIAEIVEDENFTSNDFSEIFEFYTGDIVEIEEKENSIFATKLKKNGNYKNRSLLNFMFNILQENFRINNDVYNSNIEEIIQIKDYNKKGIFIYPKILEKIKDFESN